jgi:hypothetical protein
MNLQQIGIAARTWQRDSDRHINIMLLTRMQYLGSRLLKPEKHGSKFGTGKSLNLSVKINTDVAIVEKQKWYDRLVEAEICMNLLSRLVQY